MLKLGGKITEYLFKYKDLAVVLIFAIGSIGAIFVFYKYAYKISGEQHYQETISINEEAYGEVVNEYKLRAERRQEIINKDVRNIFKPMSSSD